MKTLLSLLIVTVALTVQSDIPRVAGPVLLIDGDKSTEMKYSMSSTRGTETRAGIFSVAKQYLSFGGGKANLRTKNPSPVFEFSADSSFNVGTGVYIYRFDAHKDRRDIRVGKAKVSSSSGGVPKDRFVPTTLEEIGKGQNSIQYRMKVVSPLKPGEYCLVRSDYSCFDFGVDP